MSTDAYSALFRHIIGLYLSMVVVAFITHSNGPFYFPADFVAPDVRLSNQSAVNN